MAITAAMVKELRELTGAGMMDCKKALNETDGNMDAAVEYLQKSGAAKAVKKAGRIAAEGLCDVCVEGNNAAIVEVNSETDFVAKNDEFKSYVHAVAVQALNTSSDNMESFMAESWNEDSSMTVQEALTAKVAKIGENLTIRRFKKVTGDAVVSYVHGGGKIGVLVSAKNANDDASKEALANIAMQIAAMNPQYISESDISADEKVKIEEIVRQNALSDPFSLPKPILGDLLDKAVAGVWNAEDVAIYEEKKSNMNYLPNFLSDEAKAALVTIAHENEASIFENKIFTNLLTGRINKQYKDICLLDQVYVKAEDGKQSVGKYLESVNKDLVITEMVRFETGEGLEKKEENFAEEVAKQMGQ